MPAEPVANQAAEEPDLDLEGMMLPALLAEEPLREIRMRAGQMPKRGIEDVVLRPRNGAAALVAEP